MTTKEAHEILRQLRELEFPYTLHNAMALALLKTAAIPTIAKLLSATGQSSEKNVSKRGADTEIILIEAHDREPGSGSHVNAIARMNYLHARYRQAGKILDEDMVHTLGSALVEIVRGVDREWRELSDVELCALGVFHRSLGDAMEIPWDVLPSSQSGWHDGGHFVRELMEWTMQYENRVVSPTHSTRILGRRFMGIALFNVPQQLRPAVEAAIGTKLDDHLRESMGFPKPAYIVYALENVIGTIRPFILRHLALPRPSFMAVHVLNESPDSSGLYTVNAYTAHPWYVSPSFSQKWGVKSWLVRLFGSGIVPSEGNGKYKEAGYDLKTIGPDAQEGKGMEEMKETVDKLRERKVASACPFAV